MKRRKWTALLLAAVMVLSTAFTAMAEVGFSAPAAETESTEVLYQGEDGSVYVTHGAEGEAEGLLGGTLDDDFPVVSEFEIIADGPVGMGDVFEIRFKATDKNGINANKCEITMTTDTDEPVEFSISSSYFGKFAYDEETGIVTVKVMLQGGYIPSRQSFGKYRVASLKVTDTCGYYTEYTAESDAAAQQVFPGYVELYDNEIISNFQLNKTSLTPGETLEVSFNMDIDIEDVQRVELSFSSAEGNEFGFGSGTSLAKYRLDYDADKKKMSGSIKFSDSDLNGTYKLDEIAVVLNKNKNYAYLYHYFDSASCPEFTLGSAASVGEDWIKNLELDTGGKSVLSDYDTVKLSFTLDLEDIAGIYVYFDHGSTLSYSSKRPESSAVKYDAETGKASVEVDACEYFGEGDICLSQISVNYKNGRVAKDFEESEYAFTIASAQEFTVKQFELTENGGQVTEGKSIHFKAEIEEKDETLPVTSVTIYLEAEPAAAAIEDKNVLVESDSSTIGLSAKKNSETGLWEGEYVFKESDAYGIYYVSSVRVCHKSIKKDCIDQIGEQKVLYTKDDETYVVSFDLNGHGDAIPYQLVASGSNAVKPADPKANGWIFGGWFKDSALSEAWDFVSGKVKETMKLFAKWKADDDGDDDSGSSVPATVKPDAAVTPVTVAADGSQMLGTSVISKPVSKLTAEEKASLVEAGTWSKDAYGRWTLKNASGAQIKGGWALVSDTVGSKPVGNATWYYFDTDGYMVTGWVWIKAADGKQYCYYFNKEDGSMYGGCLLGGTTKDGFSLNAKGRWIDSNGAEQTK